MGTSNDERHSGHVDVAMADPDCALCNEAAATDASASQALDVERLSRALDHVEINWPMNWSRLDFQWIARQVAAEYARLDEGSAIPEGADR